MFSLIYEESIAILSELGWKSEKQDLNNFELNALELALERLGAVRGLKSSCFRENCEICDRLENLYVLMEDKCGM